MSFSVNPTLWRQVFAVPSDIADRHIKLCSGVALKCLLLLLRDPETFGDPAAIAKRLGQPVSEVSDALAYWVESGVLCRSEGEETPVSPDNSAASQAPNPPPAPALPAVAPQRPRYPRDEAVALVEGDKTLSDLVGELQSLLGKLLTSADLDVLVALYSFYSLSPHYILTLINYCILIGRPSMGYAEKVAASWIADGVDDEGIDRHVDRLLLRRTNEGKVRAAFGITDRNLTSREREYIATWFDRYQFDLPLIEYAYEITVERTGKLAFGYLNKILASWHQNGIRSVEEARRESKPAAAVPAGSAGGESDLNRKILEQFMKD